MSGSAFEWKLIRRIVSYTRPYKGWFIFALLITITTAVLGPLQPFLIQKALDGPVIAGDYAGLRFWIMVLIGLLVTQAIISFGGTYLTNWLGETIIRDMRIQVFKHVSSMRLRYFDRTPIGTLQTRTISDIQTLNDVFSQGLVSIMGDLLQLTAILGLMLYTNWRLTLVVLTIIPILIFATWIFKNKVKVAFQGVRKYVSLQNAFLQEHITGMLVIQIFNREKREADTFDTLNKGHRDANLNSVLYYSVFFPVIEIIGALGTALLVWYGVGNVLNGTVSFGDLVAFIMYTSMFFRPIRMLADRFNTLQLGMVSAERIFKVLDTHEHIENEGTYRIPVGKEPIGIEFENVSFAYEPPDFVLKEVSFKVNPGEKVAFVGATGAGKTTIINLLTRFYEIDRGRILLGGHDLKEFDLGSLRGTVGMVLQDVFLFSGSIYENITLNNPLISREQAMEAAKSVGADRFIQKLPGKYDYDVRERGATLSSGQRQLIAFARVMVYDPRVLILDEATSNVDTESEEMIQSALDRVLAGRTSIIIAHRLSTIQKADTIMMMSRGRICERGNHQQLLQQNGLYKKLYQLQFAGVV